MISKRIQMQLKPRIVDIHDWNCVEEQRDRIAYRPSGRTLFRRLGYTLVAVLCIGLLASIVSPVVSPRTARPIDTDLAEEMLRAEETINEELRQSVTPERWAEIEEEARRSREEREAEAAKFVAQRKSVADAVFGVAASLAGLLAFAGVMAPLSCLWNRVTITHTGAKTITVQSRGLWTSCLSISTHEFPRLTVTAREKIHARRRGWVLRQGHRWVVSLHPDFDAPIPSGKAEIIEFWIHHQKDRPVPEMPLPPRVRQLTGALERMTGATAEPMLIMDYQGVQGSWLRPRHVIAGTSTAPWVGDAMIGEPLVDRTWTVDEMPPEMRARLEPLMEESRRRGGEPITAELISTGDSITFRDEDGSMRSYNSVEDMPPHIRALFDQFQQFRSENPNR